MTGTVNENVDVSADNDQPAAVICGMGGNLAETTPINFNFGSPTLEIDFLDIFTPFFP